MEYALVDAAKLAKVNRSTLFRAIKSGKLSARRDDDGTYKVDASELARVYNLQHAPHRPNDALHSVAQGADTPTTSIQGQIASAELAFFRAQVLEEQLTREREDRARERSRWDQERDTILERERDTVADLRKRLDRAEERVLALSASPSQPPTSAVPMVEPVASAAPTPPKAPLGFLARLFGSA